ncbi:uncharacterized protein LOC133895133 [Phragmites australis]|uniref:uncharacterized protein LOC133895133 n=1 Tax=Phragmites australis TaxID=29695 RepID=UPI002D79FDB0|nr:uncharacterized protein LOC133895133 [Phragmites australis]
MDLDYALRDTAPEEPADDTPDLIKKKRAYESAKEKWERSNRMSLMIMKSTITVEIRGAIPNFESAKTYLDSVEEQSKGSSKVYDSTLIMNMLTTKYDRTCGIREHVMMMNNMTTELKGMEIPKGFLTHFIMTSFPSEFGLFKINYNTQKEKWTMNELIAMCVQEEERLKARKRILHIRLVQVQERESFKGSSSQRRSCTSPPRRFQASRSLRLQSDLMNYGLEEN